MMKAKEYAMKARKSLNYWAESHLRGGKMWSDDMGETYRIFKEIYPNSPTKHMLLAVGANAGIAVGLECIVPSMINATLAIAATGVGLSYWHTIYVYKDAYDFFGKMVEKNKAIPINNSTNPIAQRIKELWIKDHGLEKQYREARFVAETLTRTPMRG